MFKELFTEGMPRFKKGDKVVFFDPMDRKNKKAYKNAKIVSKESNGTYTIEFEDGVKYTSVKPSSLEVVKNDF
jgi:hypothetical protein